MRHCCWKWNSNYLFMTHVNRRCRRNQNTFSPIMSCKFYAMEGIWYWLVAVYIMYANAAAWWAQDRDTMGPFLKQHWLIAFINRSIQKPLKASEVDCHRRVFCSTPTVCFKEAQLLFIKGHSDGSPYNAKNRINYSYLHWHGTYIHKIANILAGNQIATEKCTMSNIKISVYRVFIMLSGSECVGSF